MSTIVHIMIVALLCTIAGLVTFNTIRIRRARKVMAFRHRIMHEEDEWIQANRILLQAVHFNGILYRRTRQLPPAEQMIKEFWVPLERYEKKLRRHEFYYLGLGDRKKPRGHMVSPGVVFVDFTDVPPLKPNANDLYPNRPINPFDPELGLE